MKNLLVILSAILACSVQADIDCSQGSYVPKVRDMVVVYDSEEKHYYKDVGHITDGQLFFNNLLDPSCEEIDVLGNIVRCISSNSKITPVGILLEKVNQYLNMVYYRVHWSPRVKVKSSDSGVGCIYGIAVE